ncbi:MAG TPA: pentapeptide repeat-containing protein [Thermoanaerobaculia bacterium]|jgi:hypothetical protein|nr:pentapeptide repeat-containing protein [Thermoanaerobaculia bacterium]
MAATFGIAVSFVAGHNGWLASMFGASFGVSFGEAAKWIGGVIGNLSAEKLSERRKSRLPVPDELITNHDLQRLSAAALSRALTLIADDHLLWSKAESATIHKMADIGESNLASVLVPVAGDPPLDVAKLFDRIAARGDSFDFPSTSIPDDVRGNWTMILTRLYVLTGVRFTGDVDRLIRHLDHTYWFMVRELLKRDGIGEGPFSGKAYRALEIQSTAWLVVLARQNRKSVRALAQRVDAADDASQQRFEQLLAAIKEREPFLVDAIAVQIRDASDRTAEALKTQRALFTAVGSGLNHLLDVVVTRLDRIEKLQRELLEETRRRHRLELRPTAQAVFDYLVATGHKQRGGPDGRPENEDGSTDLVMQDATGAVGWYCCAEGWVTENHVDNLLARAEGSGTPLVLVTSHRLLDGVQEYAASNGVRLLSLRALVIELLKLEEYPELLDARVADRIAEESWFVAPRFSVESRRRDALDRTISEGVESFVDEWLKDDTPEAVVLLGDYGAGKSAVVSRIARDRFLKFERAGDRLPVSLRAADRPGITSFNDILEEFGRRSGSRLGEPTVFQSLADAGRLLVVFDGLDELVVNKSADAFRGLLALYEGIDRRTKLLLTCRTNAFRSRQEETSAAGDPGVRTRQPFVFWRIRLEPFDESHVREYLRRRLPAESVEPVAAMMMDVYDLRNLAERPVLLDMIVSNWEAVKREAERRPGKPIEVGDLYRVYIGRWLDDAKRPNAMLTAPERVRLMTRIAVWMAEESTADLPADALATRMEEALGRGFGTNDAIEREVRLQSFLVRGADDQYYFAHRSFQEYFLSIQVADEIREGRPALLAKDLLQREVFQFVSVHGPTADDAWRLLDRSKSDPNAAILNANLLSVLRDLSPDFSGRDLRGLQAADADLRGTDFTDARLDGCHLKGCDIRDANFTRANLSGSLLKGLILGVRSAAKCVRFRPDAAEVLASDENHQVLRLPVPNGAPIVVQVHTDSVTCISAAPGGLIASGGFDGRVRLSENAGQKTRVITSHGAVVYGVAIRPGANHVASTDAKGRLKIWDLKRSGVVLDKEAHKRAGYTVEWSPAGDWLAIGSFDQTVSLWRFTNAQSIRLLDKFTLEEHQALVNGVRFSSCGRWIAAASNNGTIKVWDLEQRRLLADLKAQPRKDDIEWSVAFTPDGATLASAGADGFIRLWDWEAGTHRGFKAHDNEIWSLDFDPTGRLLASGSFDGRVRVWDVATETMVSEWAFGPPQDGLRMQGADLRGAKGLSPLQERVLTQAGGVF